MRLAILLCCALALGAAESVIKPDPQALAVCERWFRAFDDRDLAAVRDDLDEPMRAAMTPETFALAAADLAARRQPDAPVHHLGSYERDGQVIHLFTTRMRHGGDLLITLTMAGRRCSGFRYQ